MDNSIYCSYHHLLVFRKTLNKRHRLPGIADGNSESLAVYFGFNLDHPLPSVEGKIELKFPCALFAQSVNVTQLAGTQKNVS